MRTRELVLATLEKVATNLGDDLALIVFVGGTVAALYDGALDIRPTDDVDCVVRVTLPDYYALIARLKSRGFKECREEGSPICRLVSSGQVPIDVMPVDAEVLGFSNRWYAEALQEARTYRLTEDLSIRAITPIYFVSTKLEAFKSRGKGDFRASHDLEDVLSLLGQAPTLLDQVERDPAPVCRYLREELVHLSASEAFLNAIPGCFSGSPDAQEVAATLTKRLMKLGSGGQ